MDSEATALGKVLVLVGGPLISMDMVNPDPVYTPKCAETGGLGGNDLTKGSCLGWVVRWFPWT